VIRMSVAVAIRTARAKELGMLTLRFAAQCTQSASRIVREDPEPHGTIAEANRPTQR